MCGWWDCCLGFKMYTVTYPAFIYIQSSVFSLQNKRFPFRKRRKKSSFEKWSGIWCKWRYLIWWHKHAAEIFKHVMYKETKGWRETGGKSVMVWKEIMQWLSGRRGGGSFTHIQHREWDERNALKQGEGYSSSRSTHSDKQCWTIAITQPPDRKRNLQLVYLNWQQGKWKIYYVGV